MGKSPLITAKELASLNKALTEDAVFARIMNRLGDPVKIFQEYKIRVQNSEYAWTEEEHNTEIIKNIGNTGSFEMLTLIDYFTIDDKLTGEAGVSYLIRTDEANILFDLGLNHDNSDPSPLMKNMKMLGVSIDDIDTIVISHNHGDHIGGGRWRSGNTFSLTSRQIKLSAKKVYTPVIMNYPGLEPVYSPSPVKIAEGVATTGVINCPMFHADIGEQGLIINVKDVGLVVISGCGHPGVEKIILRSEALFNQPVHALLGGFHLPVSIGRNIEAVLRYTVTGKLPWDFLTKEDLEKKVNFLRKHGVKRVGISAHDSCDTTLQAFRDAFKSDYIDIMVGKCITMKEP